jgi:D-lyxose ketol-isomerase
MKRSDINQLVRDATACFEAHGWALPPEPRWDVTDFGLGDWHNAGLVLVNLAEEPEYCEKLMYAQVGMVTPMHYHVKKKEDIICRWGALQIDLRNSKGLPVKVNGQPLDAAAQALIALGPGERITLVPGVIHAFQSLTDECIIGEVSTANDDLHDNFFENPAVGRFSQIEEDEEPTVRLAGEQSS